MAWQLRGAQQKEYITAHTSAANTAYHHSWQAWELQQQSPLSHIPTHTVSHKFHSQYIVRQEGTADACVACTVQASTHVLALSQACMAMACPANRHTQPGVRYSHISQQSHLLPHSPPSHPTHGKPQERRNSRCRGHCCRAPGSRRPGAALPAAAGAPCLGAQVRNDLLYCHCFTECHGVVAG